MSAYQIRTGDRAAIVAGLRELADFLADHPDVLVPPYASVSVIVRADDADVRRSVAEAVAAPLGVPVEYFGGGHYAAHRDFGPVAYHVIAPPPERRPT
ncbi:hypothetical protein [Streptomyces radicis]|uniref:Uncharacterized protein n=1 Tax=Streptomyces radicis TaxID=1750517 RepID=A0A3A9W940_9ACTN|nr:hypothetical protein [Streptomyces radicis]RKN09400.1 hypothetical protein D7319_13165 [Streptomyces radicis]RKN23002.1 hypothetical protein D7318_13360 [Streptomyces radicis]